MANQIISNIWSEYLGFKKRHYPEVWASEIIGGYELLTVEVPEKNYISIKNKDNHYLGVRNGRFFISRDCGDEQKFKRISEGGLVCLKTKTSPHYFIGWKKGHKPEIWADADRCGTAEKLIVISNPTIPKNWMTSVYDQIKDLKLGDLTLIGTHNASMNRKKNPFDWYYYLTQYYSMDLQYYLGCRYFEVRPYHITGQSYFRGYHGIKINDNNAKRELKKLAGLVGGKELVIIDMERSQDVTRKNFIKDMKEFFGNKIICPSSFPNRKLRDITVEELTSKGNVIIMTKGFRGSDQWDRESELKSLYHETKSDSIDKLVENIGSTISNPPKEVRDKLWIHDVYLTSSFPLHILHLDNAAEVVASRFVNKFVEWKKANHRINIIKLDYFSRNLSNFMFFNMVKMLQSGGRYSKREFTTNHI